MKEEPHEVVKNQDAVDRKELERLRGVYSELKRKTYPKLLPCGAYSQLSSGALIER